MSNINFDNAWWLLLAVPLVVLVTVGFAVVTRKENVNGHSIASYVLHIVMAIIVAFAAAGTTFTTVLTETNVYVVADLSYSANKSVDAIDSYIRNMELPRNSKLGVVCFGKDYELLCEMGDPKNVKSVRDSHVDDTETNIAEALEYTGTLFKEDVIKRIVLITDGRHTDESDSYALKRAVDLLETQDVRVDAIYLDSNLKADSKEVQISEVNYTSTAFLYGAETADVIVQSTYDTQAVLTLYRDGEKIRDKAVSLIVGYNTVSFDLYTVRTGTYDYEVTIEADGDESGYNNSYLFSQIVSSDIKLLAVTQKWEDATTIIERYSGRATVEIFEYDKSVTNAAKTEYLSQYNGNSKINVHRLNLDIPFTVEDLCTYDEIILADVTLSSMTNYTEFVTNVDNVVSLYGKSLVTFGNLGIQNNPENEIVKFKNMLPVSFGGSEDPKAYTFIIDTSRSMNKLGRLDVAKALCAKLIDVLNDNDQVSVVTFNEEVRLVQPFRKLTSRSDVIDTINKLDVRQGTVIGSGLQMAYDHIMSSAQFSDKQVMLITDGLNGASSDDPVSIVKQMAEDAIVTSVYDVARGGGNAKATNLLREIALSGGGNYYSAGDLDDPLDVSFGQVSDKVTVTTVTKNTSVGISRRSDEVLDGLNLSGIPNVSGYVYSNTKASATTVLTVNHVKSSGTTPKPLYAYWNYGNGKVSVFNSQMTGTWTSDWNSSGFMSGLLDNILTVNTPEMKSVVPYNVSLTQAGKTAHIELTPAVPHLNATAKIEVIKPDGEVLTQNLTFNSSYYYFDFNTVGKGKYTVTVTYTSYNTDHISDASFNISYTSEYNAFAVFDVAVLHKALDGRGDVVENGTIKLKIDESQLSTYNVQLRVPLLIVTVAMFVADIIVRKLKWDDIKSFFSFFKKSKGKKTEGKK